MVNYSKLQYKMFRGIIGFYLSWFFYQLLPYQNLLFGKEGAFHSAKHLLFPQLLEIYPNPLFYKGYLFLMIFAGVFLGIGLLTRFWAFILWIGFVSFINYIPYFRWPSEGFVGLTLLILMLSPPSPIKCDKDHIKINSWLILMAGTILSLGYSFSGLIKYQSELWQNKEAIHLMLENPFAIKGIFSFLMGSIPETFLKYFSVFILWLQITALPFYFIHRITRKYSWLFLILMHIGIFFLIDLRIVTIPMIAMHLFIFNPKWFIPEYNFFKKIVGIKK